MSLLQILISIIGFLFLLMILDLYERKKFNLLHFLIFFGGTGLIVLFVMRPDVLDNFGQFFGVARGADLIVYVSIIFLVYLYFELLNKSTKRDIQRTELARSISLMHADGNIKDAEIVFIIPSYGEDGTAIESMTEVLKEGYAIIVVDDGKNKVNFVKELDNYMSKGLCVVLTHPFNLGQGAALQTGSMYIQKYLSNTKYVVHFDADGQHDLKDLPNYLDAFEKDESLDIVLGSRFLGESNMTAWRRFHKKLQILFMRMFVGLRLTDTNNGYRVIKGTSLPRIRITLNGMAHASEIEHIISEEKLGYTEVPVNIKYTEYSMAKGQRLSNAWNILKRLIYRWFFYK